MFTIANNNERLTQPRYITYEQMNLINTFREINMDLAIMGRMMVASLIFKSPCADAIFTRQLQIPSKMYNYFASFYGAESAQQIHNLVGQDIILMRRLTEALIARDEKEATAIMEKWYQNVDQLSDLFASLNPYWSKDQWHDLLFRYVQLNYQQITALLSNRYEQSLNIFDRIKELMILIGDYQSRGVMKNLGEVSTGMDIVAPQ